MRVLITGTSRGLGLEFVRQLAARGDCVFATCRFPDQASALNDLQVRYGDLVSITELDVANPKSIAQSFDTISTQTGALDVLINNAAISSNRQLDDDGIGSFDLERMQRILTINTIAPMLIIQQYLDLLKAGNQPKIINISSRHGSFALRKLPPPETYSASKAALNMYTRNLSYNLKDAGVITIALSPGWVKTFQGGPNADITPKESIGGMLQLIDSLTLEDSGGFFSYIGETVPW